MVWRAAWLAAGLLAAAAAAPAASTSARYCDRAEPLTAQQQARLLQFAAIARRELEAAGQPVALVSRSGIDLSRFGVRYSHAGVSLQGSANAPWSVRQLYFSCDDARPRLYDQGLAGFVLGTDVPAVGYLSIVWLPREQASALARTVLDNQRALRLLAADYSANAYPFSVRYQNCNQWVVEMLAAAWGGLPDGEALRARAQAWLSSQHYEPAAVDVGSHWVMFAGHFVPWVHFDDHPEADRFALRLRTSLPASIEAFVRAYAPLAQRVELCHDERQVVIRRGWEPLGEQCRAGPQDRVIALD
ncbi:MAG TPA: DUF2145 domain-containing protein [Burkholderiaceae bacterium]|nr:DUF2145 domain-containing protein [Burkholderiaceae bacterium]